LAGSTIGIKIADGSYYPVLEEGFTGTKRLTLTTVKDGQDRVQIDLYRGEGHKLDNARYVGSLIIENIPPAEQGEPEIDLILGLDSEGELTAEAGDRSTGESKVFSTSVRALTEDETYEMPEFAVEPSSEEPASVEIPEAETGEGLELETGAPTERGGTFDEVPLTGDTYPVSGADRRREHLHHRAPGPRPARPGLTVVLIVLAVALLAALGYVAWRLIWGPPIPPLSTLFGASPAVEMAGTQGVPAAAQPAPAAPAPAATAPSAKPPAATAAPAAAAPSASGVPPAAAAPASPAPSAGGAKGVSYRIKRGDTLWDISSTYYRNPWLYPVIAKANGIRNPDLIIAGARIFIPER
jgi:nucleoid-associated protein YgaU